MNDAVVTALTSVAGDMKDMVNSILPVALTVVGTGMAARYGIRFFKSIAGK